MEPFGSVCPASRVMSSPCPLLMAEHLNQFCVSDSGEEARGSPERKAWWWNLQAPVYLSSAFRPKDIRFWGSCRKIGNWGKTEHPLRRLGSPVGQDLEVLRTYLS